MAFRDFTFPAVVQQLGLTLAQADLFAAVPPAEVDPWFADRLRRGVELGVAVNTEKARSEFIIAPVLGEVRFRHGERFAIHSGVEFDVDAARGLNGFCDFLLSRSSIQVVVAAPLVAVAEAKNDNVRNGFGQAIAGMVAVREFNAAAGSPLPAVYGVSTNGSEWRFLRLVGADLTVDRREYLIVEVDRIMGILAHVLTAG